MEISRLTSFYDMKFPLYISTKINMENVITIEIEENIKYLVSTHHPRVPFDIVLDQRSTYLGRLLLLKRMGLHPVEFTFSFVDLAHYIYGRPLDLPKSILLVDDNGNAKRKGEVWVNRRIRQFRKRIQNYIFVDHYYPPIKIPNFEPLFEALDNYRPKLQLYELSNTLYFRNLAPKAWGKHAVRIL